MPHYNPEATRVAIENKGKQMRPVIVADGFCPGCGRPAPLYEYLHCVTGRGGYVVLDDTQALGIWGTGPGSKNPYGSGGGGPLRLHGLRSPRVILGSSLAKGFGVPLAGLSGSAANPMLYAAKRDASAYQPTLDRRATRGRACAGGQRATWRQNPPSVGTAGYDIS